MFSPASFRSFGVGGHRCPSSFSMSAGWELLSSLHRSGVPGQSVLTSCGSGVPALVRALFPGCRVFSAAEFAGLGRAAFAARAAALVRALAAEPLPLWVCFPEVAAPPALRPAGRWVSCGSGSWSECALAAGLGVTVLVFLPSGVVPPAAWGAWESAGVSPGGVWWFLPVSVGLF